MMFTDLGRIETTIGPISLYSCRRCGAVVRNQGHHEAWHTDEPRRGP